MTHTSFYHTMKKAQTLTTTLYRYIAIVLYFFELKYIKSRSVLKSHTGLRVNFRNPSTTSVTIVINNNYTVDSRHGPLPMGAIANGVTLFPSCLWIRCKKSHFLYTLPRVWPIFFTLIRSLYKVLGSLQLLQSLRWSGCSFQSKCEDNSVGHNKDHTPSTKLAY